MSTYYTENAYALLHSIAIEYAGRFLALGLLLGLIPGKYQVSKTFRP